MRARRPGRRLQAALMGAGAATVYIVGRDGSLAWQVVRVAGVVLHDLRGLPGAHARHASAASRRGLRGGVRQRGGRGGHRPTPPGEGRPASVDDRRPAVPRLGSRPARGRRHLPGPEPARMATRARPLRRSWQWSPSPSCRSDRPSPPRTFRGPSVGTTTPGDRGLSYRDVELHTTDGVTLSGWYIPSANHAAVALLHGAGSTRSSVLDHAVVLARHGYGVLLFDAAWPRAQRRPGHGLRLVRQRRRQRRCLVPPRATGRGRRTDRRGRPVDGWRRGHRCGGGRLEDPCGRRGGGHEPRRRATRPGSPIGSGGAAPSRRASSGSPTAPPTCSPQQTHRPPCGMQSM